MSKMIASMIVTGALLLGACTEARQSLDPNFGDAVSQNLAVHIIDPAPAAAANTDIDISGPRAAVGYQRYQTDTVPPPRELRTSEVEMIGN